MSYFMITCGRVADFSDLAPIELVPAPDAQSYIHPMANTLAGMNQAPVYLVDDGTTGTSDDFVTDGENALINNGTLEGSVLFSVIQRLAAQGNAILIWLANNDLLAYQAAEPCSSVEELLAVVRRQTAGNRPIQVFLPANPAVNTDAAR